MVVNDIAPDAVGGTNVVSFNEVREGSAKVSKEPRIVHGYGNSRRTPLPDPHEPDRVDVQAGKGIPFLFGDGSK